MPCGRLSPPRPEVRTSPPRPVSVCAPSAAVVQPLRGACTESLGSGSLKAAPGSAPAAPLTTTTVRAPRIAVTTPGAGKIVDLGGAFWAFGQSDAIHRQLKGQPSGEALYSQACCLSLAVEQQLLAASAKHKAPLSPADLMSLPLSVPAGAVVAPELPPKMPQGCPLRSLLESRLDLALELLSAASAAGYPSDGANQMQSDADLRVVRELRPGHFATLLHQAQLRTGDRSVKAG